jgi:hypothetical protein
VFRASHLPLSPTYNIIRQKQYNFTDVCKPVIHHTHTRTHTNITMGGHSHGEVVNRPKNENDHLETDPPIIHGLGDQNVSSFSPFPTSSLTPPAPVL